MPNRFADTDALVLKIHSAALAPDGWNSIGNDIRMALNAKSALGLRVISNPYPHPWGLLTEFDPTALANYINYWAQYDVVYHSAVRTGRVRTGQVSASGQLIDQQGLERSAFYNEYLKPADIGDMMQVCLAGSEISGLGPAALSFYRDVGGTPFSLDDLRLLANLAPHLTVAAQTYWSAQSLRMLDAAYRCALDTVTSAVVGVGESGRVSFMNRTGEELLRKQHWLQIVNSELSPAATVAETAALTTALRQLAAGFAFKVLTTDKTTGAQAIIRGAPLPDSARMMGSEGTASLVWITAAALTVDIAGDMAMLFALTPAETRLVGRLILGDDLRSAAECLHISLHTARTQLKVIFGKTGKRTQAALLSFAARLSTLRTPH